MTSSTRNLSVNMRLPGPSGGQTSNVVGKGKGHLFPIPMRFMYFSFALAFVIYLPVSIFNSNIFLILLDILLWLAIVLTLMKMPPKYRLFGGNVIIYYLLMVFLFSVFVGIAVDSSATLISRLRGARSLLFGLGYFALSSIWMINQERVIKFLKINLWGSLIAAIYGVWQFRFGLLPFEINHLGNFGGLVAEISYTGRIRIPSVFVDPATFAFMMMFASIILPAMRAHLAILKSRIIYVSFQLLLLGGLLMSLVRSSLVAFAIAVLFLFFIQRRHLIKKYLQVVFLGFAGLVTIYFLNYSVMQLELTRSNNSLVKGIGNVIESLWSVLPSSIIDSGTVNWRLSNLRTISIRARMSGWLESIDYLLRNPFGGGVGSVGEGTLGFNFSPVDVGFMRFGLEIGWTGLFAILGIFFVIALSSVLTLRRIKDYRIRKLSVYLLTAWVGFFAALMSTSFLHTEILGAIVWTIAGVLINLDLIAIRSLEKEKRG